MDALCQVPVSGVAVRTKRLETSARRPTSYALAPGAVLDGRFEIAELINRSGMASIFRARDLKSGATVAIKVPLMECESDPIAFDRFRREETIAKRLDHPDIVKVIASEEPKSRPYLAMEYLEGERLDLMLARLKPMPEEQAVALSSRLCAALDHMHGRGIVHRDVKPENVILCDDGTMRILDFGIAKAEYLPRMTYAGFTLAMGTPDYMAPERVEGQRGDPRTDVYSLGAILYEMVTGRMPFPGDSVYAVIHARTVGDPQAPRAVNPKVSPVLEEIILHALARDPKDRYPTAAAMKAELDNFDLVRSTERHRGLQTGGGRSPALRLLAYTGAFALLQAVLFGLILLRSGHPGR